MPIYEYQCPQCDHRFSHLWRTLAAAGEGLVPPCPECSHPETSRVISQVQVLGGMGGLTPGETAQVKAQEERLAAITPKEQIQQLQANKLKTDRQQ